MGIPLVHTCLSRDAVPEALACESPVHGAGLQFRGVVRDTENGRPVAGLNYSAYRPMAEKKLREIAEAAALEHPEARIFIHHVVGFVAAGKPSLLIAVNARHSAEAFELCAKLLRRVKTEVPIWKEAVE
jgi:molybdopterin synthase catalytic subunit